MVILYLFFISVLLSIAVFQREQKLKSIHSEYKIKIDSLTDSLYRTNIELYKFYDHVYRTQKIFGIDTNRFIRYYNQNDNGRRTHRDSI
jgi:hypothetical protein